MTVTTLSYRPELAENSRLQTLDADDAYRLLLRVTLVLVILQGSTAAFLDVPVRILCGAMLVEPTFLVRPVLWWTLTCAMIGGNGSEWYKIDNHIYLITYWVLACTLSLHVNDASEWLKRTARLLIASVFSFAVLWKIAGGEFVNGSFFYFTFLTDPRLQRVTAALTGLRLEEITAVREAVAFAGGYGLEGVALSLPTSAALTLVTLTMSWVGILAETIVAVLHVAATRFEAARHYALIGFILMTYFLLPVVGFASIVAILGCAQCEKHESRMRTVYLTTLCIVQAAMIPWQELLFSRV